MPPSPSPHAIVQTRAIRSLRQRIRPHLDMHGARLRALAAFHQPRRAVAVRAPQPATLPTGVRVVDASVQTLGEEAHRVWHAHQDHAPVPERREAVLEVGGRDRNVLAQAHRVVLIYPGVIARLSAVALEALEPRPRISVEREAFRAMVAGRVRSVERPLALAAVEADQAAVPARPPHHPLLFDVAPPPPHALPPKGVELPELRLWVGAQEA